MLDDNPRFQRLLDRLQQWCDEEQEDRITLTREEVIVLLGGIEVIAADDPEEDA